MGFVLRGTALQTMACLPSSPASSCSAHIMPIRFWLMSIPSKSTTFRKAFLRMPAVAIFGFGRQAAPLVREGIMKLEAATPRQSAHLSLFYYRDSAPLPYFRTSQAIMERTYPLGKCTTPDTIEAIFAVSRRLLLSAFTKEYIASMPLPPPPRPAHS
jgi:hypothetical protein